MQIKEKQSVEEKIQGDLWKVIKEITLIGNRNNRCDVFYEMLLYREEHKN